MTKTQTYKHCGAQDSNTAFVLLYKGTHRIASGKKQQHGVSVFVLTEQGLFTIYLHGHHLHPAQKEKRSLYMTQLVDSCNLENPELMTVGKSIHILIDHCIHLIIFNVISVM